MFVIFWLFSDCVCYLLVIFQYCVFFWLFSNCVCVCVFLVVFQGGVLFLFFFQLCLLFLVIFKLCVRVFFLVVFEASESRNHL